MSDSDLKEKETTVDPEAFEKEFGDKFSDDEKAKLDDLSDQVGKGFTGPTDNDTRKKSRFSRKQKGMSGVIAGLVIGGGFGVMSVMSGPLQFIHISQLLQRFHFSSVEDNGNSRILKLYKFSKNIRGATTHQNLRLSVLGNRIAGKMDIKLAEIGFEKTYKPGVTAVYDGIVIDPVKFSENAPGASELKRLPPEEFSSKFKEIYGVEPKFIDGQWKIPPEEGMFSYFKNRRLNKTIVGETGTDGIAGRVSSRIMGKRDGITWHPIKRLDAKIVGTLDAKFATWLAEMKARIKNGSGIEVSATGDTIPDPNDPSKQIPDPATNEGVAATEGVAADAEKALASGEGSTEGILRKFTGSTTGKLTLGATAAVGLVCAAKGLSDAADGLKHDLVVLPLIRMGMQAMSLGNQAMSGQDIDMTQLGFFSKQLNDPEDGSWAAAKSIPAELGQEQTGPDIPDEANIKNLANGSAFTQILDKIPGIGLICDAAGSTIGKAITFAISVTTPVATAVTTLAMETPAAKNAIAGLVKWMAGSPIPTLVFGPTFGNYINYGARLGANNTKAAAGGAKLTRRQSSALREERLIALKEELKHQSLYDRIANPYSADSLVAKAIDTAPSSPQAVMAQMSNFISSPASLFSSVFRPFTSKASASSGSYDYGFEEIGFSLDDMNDNKYEDPYKNVEDVKTILAGSNGQEYISRATECFGVTLSLDGDVTSSFSSLDTTSKKYPAECADSSTEWTRIRFAIMDTKTAESMDCYFGEATSCEKVGFGNNTSSATSVTINKDEIGQPSDNIACAPGTKDLGIQDGYYKGVLIKIRVCGIPGFPSASGESQPGNPYYVNGADGNVIVNSRVSGATLQLFNGAKTGSLNLDAISSFRTMAHQQALCRNNANCNSGNNNGEVTVATPGTSNHQLGVAIDYDLKNGVGLSASSYTTANGLPASTSNPRIATGPVWTWLSLNAQNYGMKQLWNEPWHWSATGN